MILSKPDHNRRSTAVSGQSLYDEAIVLQEVLLEHEVFRRVSADGQLRKCQQVNASVDRLLPKTTHPLGVAIQVAHSCVELS
jgi:hypothetical protein